MSEGKREKLGDAWWASTAKRVLHPIEVQIIEVLWRACHPLEIVDLVGMIGHQPIDDHLERLRRAGVVAYAGSPTPPREGMHVSYQLVLEPPDES